jgi:hypothetical protein
VRNGNRWTVTAVDAARGLIVARRLDDGARAAFHGDYLREHITHGYATTIHANQGVTAQTTHAVFSDRTSRAMAYVALTRGRESNSAYIYERIGGEGEHEHRQPAGFHVLRRGTSRDAATLLRNIATNRDERPQTVHQVAAGVDPDQLPERLVRFTAQRAAAVRARRAAHARWRDSGLDQLLQRQRWISQHLHPSRQHDHGLDHDIDL